MIQAILSPFRFHLEGIKTAIAGRMAYRTDFFVSMLIMFLVEFLVPAVTVLIYRTGSAFPGWNLYEALLIQTAFLLAKGVASPLLCGMTWNTIRRVRDGTYDLLMIKPRSVLHMTIVTGFDSEDMGKFFGGLVLLGILLWHLPQPGIMRWGGFLLVLSVSILVLFSFSLIIAGISFKWMGCGRVVEMFDSVSTFGLYPRSIYSKAFQNLITALIPVAVIGFFPASVLLGKPLEGIVTASLVGLLFFFASLGFWRLMLGHYSSAGG